MRNEKGQFMKGMIAWNKDSVGVIRANKTSFTKGHVMSEEIKLKISKSCQERGIGNWMKNKIGENANAWKKDSKLIISDKHHGTLYSRWRKNVYKRDCHRCRIDNYECSSGIVPHHILPWRNYLKERYNINNGITLCHAHHPRKRAEEKRLASIFTGLVSVSNGLSLAK